MFPRDAFCRTVAGIAGQGKWHLGTAASGQVGPMHGIGTGKAAMTDLRAPQSNDTSPSGGRLSEPVTEPTVPTWRTSKTVSASDVAPGTSATAAPNPPSRAQRLRAALSFRRVVTWLFLGSFGIALAILGLIVAYRFITPPVTATIIGERLSGQRIAQTWVPLERISPHLIAAVVTSEDSGFCRHRGVDWRELAEVVENVRDGSAARGGSTIPMQTVKNLFLWSSKSYVRKAIEIPVTLVADPIWGKRRTLEIYLNIAEWGPGVFGAEAAAHYHFRKPAARLTETEAALLAAALPSPIARDSGDPSAQQQRLAQRLIERMRQSPLSSARFACLGLEPRG